MTHPFLDLSKSGDVKVMEYDDEAGHFALLICFGKEGHTIKISAEQGTDLHSALCRVYSLVQDP